MATEQLQAEARERPRMAGVAFAAALLTLSASIVGIVVLDDQPESLIGQTLERQDHVVGLAVIAACSALGLLALTIVLDFLLRAARARRPDLAWQLRPLLWSGGLVLAVLVAVLQVVTSVRLDHFANESSQTYEEARAVSDFGVVAYVAVLAQFAFAGAIVAISVSAMRVGLLTRFLGYLGVISAVLFVIPLPLVPVPIVQAYWLGAFGLLLIGRSPTGTPPAWQSGEAMPWPSPAEMRDLRVREAEARGGGSLAGENLTVPDDASELQGAPGSTGARRKRKKRR